VLLQINNTWVLYMNINTNTLQLLKGFFFCSSLEEHVKKQKVYMGKQNEVADVEVL
jgi:hypothetical protein